MHSFLIEPGVCPGQTAPLSDEEAGHALRVLRLPQGARVRALDGCGRAFDAELTVTGKRAALLLLNEAPAREPALRVTMYLGLLKGERMEYALQKCTELGAHAIVPTLMARCVARGGDGWLARARRIALEAAKQCGRAHVPVLCAPMPMAQAARAAATHALALVPWEEAGRGGLRQICAERPGIEDAAVYIGPEGGIEAQEVELLEQCGARTLTLGARILRAETACVAALALLMGEYGELGT